LARTCADFLYPVPQRHKKQRRAIHSHSIVAGSLPVTS